MASRTARKVLQLQGDLRDPRTLDALFATPVDVLTHPGPASGSVSDQIASLIREPLRGQRTTCRLAADTPVVVASVDNVVRSFSHLGGLPEPSLQGGRTMNLPGLTVTPMQIVQSVARRAPQAGAAFVDWHPDAGLQRIVDSWPRVFTSQRVLAIRSEPRATARLFNEHGVKG